MKRDIGVATASDPALAAARSLPEQAPTPAPEAPQSAPYADLRLVIEEDSETGDFIYTTLDRRTGEVILQLPRREMMKTLSSGGYQVGDLIKTRA